MLAFGQTITENKSLVYNATHIQNFLLENLCTRYSHPLNQKVNVKSFTKIAV